MGYALKDGEKTIELSGKIPANGFYLVIGAAEDTADELLTCDLPDADMTCNDWATGGITLGKKVVWFNANLWDGLDRNKAYVFGGRSFSIYEATDTGLRLVYDSGSDFEAITAEKLAANFNTSNDKTSMDNRSGKKGPEPESVVTGVIGNKTFAFIALERIGGVMVYDITDPANAKFANYINSREFDETIKGDVSPEGLCFIPAASSKTGKAMLLAACEVSGTLAAYQCDSEQSETHEYKVTDGANGTWNQNSGGTLIIRADGDINKFTGLKVNDTLIDASNYTAVSGSTIVTLKAEYLRTLSVGTHRITFVYIDGECSTTFEVRQAASGQTTPTAPGNSNPNTDTPSHTVSPKTGDHSNVLVWAVLMVASIAGILGIVVYSKRKYSISE